MTDEMLNYYGRNFVSFNINQLFDITFREFLTQPEVYLKKTRQIVKYNYKKVF